MSTVISKYIISATISEVIIAANITKYVVCAAITKCIALTSITKYIIVETSYNSPEVIRNVSEYGVNYYILKPFGCWPDMSEQ